MPLNNFKWIEVTFQFNEDFIKKNYIEESDEGYFLEAHVQYPEILHDLHNDLLFLSEKMTTEKVEKLAANLHGKTESVIHIRNLKQAFKHGLLFKKFHRIINSKYNKTIYWCNHRSKKKAKDDFEKDFFKLMNYAVS